MGLQIRAAGDERRDRALRDRLDTRRETPALRRGWIEKECASEDAARRLDRPRSTVTTAFPSPLTTTPCPATSTLTRIRSALPPAAMDRGRGFCRFRRDVRQGWSRRGWRKKFRRDL